MADKKWNSGNEFGAFACVTGVGALCASIVSRSLMPLFVAGFGLYLVFGFFSGVATGAESTRNKSKGRFRTV